MEHGFRNILSLQGNAEAAQFMQIYRSREVGQSYITSVGTSLIAIAHAIWFILKIRPQVVWLSSFILWLILQSLCSNETANARCFFRSFAMVQVLVFHFVFQHLCLRSVLFLLIYEITIKDSPCAFHRDAYKFLDVNVHKLAQLNVLQAAGLRWSSIFYIESIARVRKLSLSGLLLYKLHLTDQFVVQWPQLQSKYPRSQYVGRIM